MSSQDGNDEKPRAKRGRKPREKDMPQRPLSAYNLFFRDERQRILAEIEKQTPPDDYTANLEAAQKRLDGKRAGAAKFQAIARTVASRWSALSDRDKEPFQKLAKEEMERYKVKKEEYQRRVLARSQGALDNEHANAAKLLQLQAQLAQSGARPHDMIGQHASGTGLMAGGTPPRYLIPPGGQLASINLPALIQQQQQLSSNLASQALMLPGPSIGTGVASLPTSALQGHFVQPNAQVLLSLRAEDLRRREAALANTEQQLLDARLRELMAAQQSTQLFSMPPQEQQLRVQLDLERQRQALVEEQQLCSQLAVSGSSQQGQAPAADIVSQEMLASLPPEQRAALLEELSRRGGT